MRWWLGATLVLTACSSGRASLVPRAAPLVPRAAPVVPRAAPLVATPAWESYVGGDCVTWNEGFTTAVVPCTALHLMEVIGRATEGGGAGVSFPSKAEWDNTVELQCAPLAAPYLGYLLDEAGRFAVTDLHPSAAGWNEGEREVLCGIEAKWPGTPFPYAPRQFLPFRGRVKGQDQAYLYGTGSCVDLPTGTVACSEPHLYEITGTYTISSAPTFPIDDDGWDAAVGSGCEQPTLHYTGGRLPAGASIGWVPFFRSSWDMGRRVIECAVVRRDANGLVEATGSLRALP
jgi:hypothetical protein